MVERWLPVWEIAFGALALILSLLIHGLGMAYVQRLRKEIRHLPRFRPHREFKFSLLILLLSFTHLVEVLLWAAALVLIGAIGFFRDAFYYAAVTYTTLGYGENTLPHQWRILAPMMAMSGVFAFGWTTSVLFSIVSDDGAAPPAAPPPPGDAEHAATNGKSSARA